MEIESSPVQRKFVQIRLPLGIAAVIILIADYWGWGWAPLTDAAAALVITFQILLCLTYLALLAATSSKLNSMHGWPLLRRYLYVLGFAVVYAATGHWWLAVFQLGVLVTLTAFVIEHKKQVDDD